MKKKNLLDLNKFKKEKELQEELYMEEQYQLMMEEASYLAQEMYHIMRLLGGKEIKITWDGDFSFEFMEDEEYEKAYGIKRETEDDESEN